MSIKLGQKLPKSAGWIRLVCPKCMGSTKVSARNSHRTFIHTLGGERLNCCYCDGKARFISIPEGAIKDAKISLH